MEKLNKKKAVELLNMFVSSYEQYLDYLRDQGFIQFSIFEDKDIDDELRILSGAKKIAYDDSRFQFLELFMHIYKEYEYLE